jgi:hypothetical protein
MSKPEFWWCVKSFDRLVLESVRRTRKIALADRIGEWKKQGYAWTTKIKLPGNESIVRIRVEEVGRKKIPNE